MDQGFPTDDALSAAIGADPLAGAADVANVAFGPDGDATPFPDADGDDAPDDAGDDDPEADESGEPDDGDGDDDDDPLAAREAALREREAKLAEAERQRQQAESERYWSDKWASIEGEHAENLKAVFAHARNVPFEERDDYVAAWVAELDRRRTAKVGAYYQEREQALWQHAARQAVPLYAQEVAKHYGLAGDDAKRLLKYHPEQMPAVAEEIRDLRRAQKKAVAAQTLPKARPGSGRGGGARVPRGSDAHLALLLGRG